MRDLYDRLGAMDAELMIVEAFLKEQARHERIQTHSQAPRKDFHVEQPKIHLYGDTR